MNSLDLQQGWYTLGLHIIEGKPPEFCRWHHAPHPPVALERTEGGGLVCPVCDR